MKTLQKQANLQSSGIPPHPVEKRCFQGGEVSHDTHDDTSFVEWLPIPSAKGYEASNTGQIRNAKTKRLLKFTQDRDGYLRVSLGSFYRCRLVHQIIAEAFIGECPDDWTVDHIDTCKCNNHATNLEYVTRGENLRRGTRNGLYPRGEKHYASKLTRADVIEIKRQFPHRNNCELARQFGVSDVSIRKIRLGKTWTHV